VRGEGTAEGVAGHAFVDAGFSRRARNGPLHDRLVQMVAAFVSVVNDPPIFPRGDHLKIPPLGVDE
jgi:hypothetical protein